MLALVLIVAGCVAAVVGVACWSIPTAMIVAGLCLVAAGLDLTRGDR